MSRWYSTATSALVFLFACGHNSVDETSDPSGTPPETGEVETGTGTGSNTGTGTGTGDGTVTEPGTGGGEGGPAAACPVGTNGFSVSLGAIPPDQVSDLAVDSAGNALVATHGAGLDGVAKVSASGEVLFTRPFGSVVATDKAGNAYIAGAFSQPIDLGLGLITPEGNVDVFVVKLDAAGNVVFAVPLHLCGDGVTSIAVDASGRIAVSGTEMGTVLLSADGTIEATIYVSGKLAFTSKGDLVIAGSFTRVIDLGDGPIDPGFGKAFVAVFDATGTRVWSQVITGAGVNLNDVAVDSTDAIILAGFYTGSIDLFGEHFEPNFAEPGRVTGAFYAKLDASGALILKNGEAPGVELNGVGVTANDGLVFTGAITANARYFRAPQFFGINAGAVLGGTAFTSGADGRGISVAVDSCGSVFMTLNVTNPVVDLFGFNLQLVKFAQ